jgi:hypothetical protein
MRICGTFKTLNSEVFSNNQDNKENLRLRELTCESGSGAHQPPGAVGAPTIFSSLVGPKLRSACEVHHVIVHAVIHGFGGSDRSCYPVHLLGWLERWGVHVY